MRGMHGAGCTEMSRHTFQGRMALVRGRLRRLFLVFSAVLASTGLVLTGARAATAAVDRSRQPCIHSGDSRRGRCSIFWQVPSDGGSPITD